MQGGINCYQESKPNEKAMQKAAVKRVGVIGSGAAGLQVAKCMIASGFDCIVIEKAPKVGGLWQSNYRSADLRSTSLNNCIHKYLTI